MSARSKARKRALDVLFASDVRGGVIGGVSSRFVYKSPELGPPFLERLYSETDLTVTADQRQLIDWLAQLE